MPTPREVSLAEQYSIQQAQLSASLAQAVAALFPLLDMNRLDATFERYLREMLTLVTTRRIVSAQLAGAYYLASREAAGIDSAYRPVYAGPVNEEALRTSLAVTGVVAVKKSMLAGRTIAEARNSALAATIGAVQRHVVTGGRQTILSNVSRDRRSVGWARVLRGKSNCWFCAMLASRGAVYKSKSLANSRSADAPSVQRNADFKLYRYHDHCDCQAVPVYDFEGTPDSGRADDLYEAWQSVTGSIYNNPSIPDQNAAARAAFRRYWTDLQVKS